MIAQERIRAISGRTFALPAYLSDEEFNVVIEEICAENNANRLAIIVERLRDDLIEGWHRCQAYDGSLFSRHSEREIEGLRESWHAYKDAVFRPAIQRLTLLCLNVVKYRGSVSLFEQPLELIRETFNASHRLHGLRLSTARGSRSKEIDDHLSHTMVALEALIVVYAVGAYISKRRRFVYLRPLLRLIVRAAGLDAGAEGKTMPMAMWPLNTLWGEPRVLEFRSGRIDVCLNRIQRDATVSSLLGGEEEAEES